MRILCVIDSLGSGGAQRQMVNLVCGLKSKGHDVKMFVYFPQHTFFRPLIDEAGIPVHEVTKGRGFSFKVLWRLMKHLRTGQFDGVISFLAAPNIYCELARLGGPRFHLVVSERSSKEGDRSRVAAMLLRFLHVVADYVVANSEAHTTWLRRLPWLRKKTRAIYNGFCVTEYRHRDPKSKDRPLQYLVVGRVSAAKNGVRLIEALALYQRKHGTFPIVSWAGRRETDGESRVYIEAMEQLLAQYPGVGANWYWLGERDDVPDLLATHDALLHPSLYEGLPNVVCEALIAGCPVIASNVCDHPLLVEEGVRGVLCDPLSAESICAAIERFEALRPVERMQMSVNARKYAEEYLSIERMVNAYETLLQSPPTMQSN